MLLTSQSRSLIAACVSWAVQWTLRYTFQTPFVSDASVSKNRYAIHTVLFAIRSRAIPIQIKFILCTSFISSYYQIVRRLNEIASSAFHRSHHREWKAAYVKNSLWDKSIYETASKARDMCTQRAQFLRQRYHCNKRDIVVLFQNQYARFVENALYKYKGEMHTIL